MQITKICSSLVNIKRILMAYPYCPVWFYGGKIWHILYLLLW